MAVQLATRLETFKVILRIDGSLVKNDEEYNEYLKTLDESILKFEDGAEEPTRIVMRKVLPYALAQKVENQKLKFKDGEVQMQTAFIMEEVRCSIVDIENPGTLPNTKHGDGGASIELIEILVGAGVINDLYTARQNMANKKDLKKK